MRGVCGVEGLIRSKFTVLPGIYDGEDGFCFGVDGVEYIMPIRVMCEYAARAASISALALNRRLTRRIRGDGIGFLMRGRIKASSPLLNRE